MSKKKSPSRQRRAERRAAERAAEKQRRMNKTQEKSMTEEQKKQKEQQIGRLSRKAAEQIWKQFPNLSVDVGFLEGWIGAQMWDTPDADTYTVGVKRGPNYQLAIEVIPVYGHPPIPTAKKTFGI